MTLDSYEPRFTLSIGKIMKKHTRSRIGKIRQFAAAAAAMLAVSISVQAAEKTAFPERPVHIIVPYSPGGTTDWAARQVSNILSQMSGASFVVENKPGAAGRIGTGMVATAKPDGYTLLTNDTSYAMLPSIYNELSWDHARDLVAVNAIARTPVVLVVPMNSPFKTVEELVGYAKKNPGKLNFASSGPGSSTHLAAELFLQRNNIELTHIPYKGSGDAFVATIGEQVDLFITALPTAVPHVTGKKLRALAVSGEQRFPALPAVPTFAEAGVPDFNITNWFGIAAPKNTPTEVLDKLDELIAKAVATPAIQKNFNAMGAEAWAPGREKFASFIKQETNTWREVSRKAGIKPQ